MINIDGSNNLWQLYERVVVGVSIRGKVTHVKRARAQSLGIQLRLWDVL